MSKQTDNKQFWQRWASCYGPLMQSSEPLYAAIAQQMQPHLTPEMNVLELACGSGQLSFRLSRLVRDWEATDFSPKMIAQAKLKPREVLKVVNDQRGNPTSTIAVAQALNELLRHPELVGTYHLTCEGEATWYDFACRIFELAHVKQKVIPCTSEEFRSPAKRPANSRLAKKKLEYTLNYKMPSWDTALADYLTRFYTK